jgi:tetratricopeptide (TPR) repeat protein
LGLWLALGVALPTAGGLREDAERLEQLSRELPRLVKQKRYRQALPLGREAVRLSERIWGPDHFYTAFLWSYLASTYAGLGRDQEVERSFARALPLLERRLGRDIRVPYLLCLPAYGYIRSGRHEKAARWFERIRSILERKLGPDDPMVAEMLYALGDENRLLGRYGEAERLYARALAIYEQKLGQDHPRSKSVRRKLRQLRQKASGAGEGREGN